MSAASLKTTGGSLPALLQSSLNQSVNSYLGNLSCQMGGCNRVVSSIQGASPKPLNEDVKAKLVSSFADAYIQDWSVPQITSPLSEQTLRFLRAHTVEDLVACLSPPSQDNPILSFCLDILKSTVTQIASHAITEHFSKGSDLPRPSPTQTTEESQEKALDKNFTFQRGVLLASNGAIMFDCDTLLTGHTATIDIENEINFSTYHEGAAENGAIPYANQEGMVYDYEATFLPDYTPSDLYSSSHDPSLATIHKIASQDVQRLIRSGISDGVKSHLTEIGEATAIDRMYQSMGEGNHWLDAATVGVEAAQANQTFLRYANRVVATAATTGVFLSKVEEMGWEGASAEMAKSVAIGFVSKYSAKIVTTLVGCAHPIWCARALTTIIADSFSVTETAPPEHDMMRPLPPPSLENVIRSRLPPLDPPYPTLRSFDHYGYTQ